MGLVACEECTKEVSDKALSCPHCGVPIVLAKVVLDVEGWPRRLIGTKPVDVYWDGDLVGTVGKGETKIFEFASGGTIEFVSRVYGKEIRFSTPVADGSAGRIQMAYGTWGGLKPKFDDGSGGDGTFFFGGFLGDIDI